MTTPSPRPLALLTVPIVRVGAGLDLPLPAYATAGSAGLDLLAAIPLPLTLAPGQRALIPTGVQIALPEGVEAQVRARSGLALKHGIACLNAPGTIDSDYRGEIAVLLINHGDTPFVIQRGLRIAQLVIATTLRATWHEITVLPDTVRGGGGFGSTGGL